MQIAYHNLTFIKLPKEQKNFESEEASLANRNRYQSA